ncbi:hypothetical protein [Amycolatopsis sp. cg13]|uniref:hypothetical protein n=1 Tax=Amycolatopsis sp. cg13 TaxID=3238807 RepID=UPI0035233CDE
MLVDMPLALVLTLRVLLPDPIQLGKTVGFSLAVSRLILLEFQASLLDSLAMPGVSTEHAGQKTWLRWREVLPSRRRLRIEQASRGYRLSNEVKLHTAEVKGRLPLQTGTQDARERFNAGDHRSREFVGLRGPLNEVLSFASTFRLRFLPFGPRCCRAVSLCCWTINRS